jgi:hypothetical protein
MAEIKAGHVQSNDIQKDYIQLRILQRKWVMRVSTNCNRCIVIIILMNLF